MSLPLFKWCTSSSAPKNKLSISTWMCARLIARGRWVCDALVVFFILWTGPAPCSDHVYESAYLWYYCGWSGELRDWNRVQRARKTNALITMLTRRTRSRIKWYKWCFSWFLKGRLIFCPVSVHYNYNCWNRKLYVPFLY